MTQTLVEVGAVADRHDRDAIEEVKTVTHDKVVAELGDRRRGPVKWGFVESQHAGKVLRDLGYDWSDIGPLVKFLSEHDQSVLVVASAECD